MNILFLSTENPFPPDHGHYLRTYNVLKYLAVHHNVFFLAFIKSEEELNNVEPIREICKSADVFIIPDNVSKIKFLISLLLNFFSPLPYIAQKYYRNDMRQKVREILKRERIDVVHFDMLHLARYRNELDGIPSVLTEHNVESSRILTLLKNSSNFIFKSFMFLQYVKLKKFESLACKDFNVCVAVSETDKSMLETMSPSARFVVVPNGVDTTYFAPDELCPDANTVIWAGSMNDMYNSEAVDFFLDEVFPLIHQEIPNIKFTAIGKAPTKKLLSLAKRNKYAIPVGYVDDVRPYINSAAVYIAPIKSGGGTKLKVLNALSMAKPVVTTSVGAEGIDAIENEHLLIADDPRAFAEKTIYLLKNPEFASRLGANGRKLIVKKYDWKIIGEKMNRIYDGLLNSKHSYNNSKKMA